MYKIFVVSIFLIFISCGGFAATPATECPTGYIQLREANAVIGYNYCSSIGSITPVEIEKPIYSCLNDNPEPVCTMFIPKGKKFTDETGEYTYNEPCALE